MNQNPHYGRWAAGIGSFLIVVIVLLMLLDNEEEFLREANVSLYKKPLTIEF